MHRLVIYINILINIIFSISLPSNGGALSYDIKYSQSIDVLNFMDKLSEWEKTPASSVYKNYWRTHGFQKNNDEKYLLDYKKIRKKYYLNKFLYLFSENHRKQDIISSSFYDIDNPKKAIYNLRSKIKKEDYIVIKNSINHFLSRIIKITGSQSHEDLTRFLNSNLNQKDTKDYIKSICAFYKVNAESIKIKITMSWFLKELTESAYFNMNTIVLPDFTYQNNIFKDMPNSNSLQRADNMSILLHEIVHLISSNASLEQKKRLSDIFYADFISAKSLPPSQKQYLLEEPMAVILGQMIYTKKTAPDYYEKCQNWYINPWVNTVAILKERSIANYMHNNISIDENLIKSFAKTSNLLTKMPTTIEFLQ